MTKFSKNLTSIVISILFFSVIVNAEEYTITETFDDVVIGTEGTTVNYYIEADTIVDDTNAVPQVTIYKKYNVEGTCGAEVIVKERNKDVLPYINGSGEFVTGNSTVFTGGISEWYSVAGFRYKLPQTCNSTSLAFDYYNIDDENAGLSIVIQRVDENGLVLWEMNRRVASYRSWVNDWYHVALDAATIEGWTQGREFNVVWLVATELSIQSNEGSYFDNLNMTLNTVDAIAAGTSCDIEVEELNNRVSELVIETEAKESEVISLSNEVVSLSARVVTLSDETKLNECTSANIELTKLIDVLAADNQQLALDSAKNAGLITENEDLLNRLNILIAENNRLESIATSNTCAIEIEELNEKINILEEENNTSITERIALIFEKACPIEGEWRNHGQYVKCVTQLRNRLRKEYNASIKETAKVAIQSNIGKTKYYKISMK